VKEGPILVGVDGSPESREALVWAADLARATGASVLAVHAVGLLEKLGPAGSSVPSAGHLEEIRTMFETSWCEPVRNNGVSVEMQMRYGTPADVVMSAAEQEGAGVVVVGSRGSGRAARGGLGSTSSRLAMSCPVPVVIVPGAQVERESDPAAQPG